MRKRLFGDLTKNVEHYAIADDIQLSVSDDLGSVFANSNILYSSCIAISG